MGGKRRSHVWLWTVTLAAACAGDPVAPTLAACHSSVQPLALSVGADTAIDPLQSGGCVLFPANASATDSVEYLLVPQAATDIADRHSSFKLTGGVPVTAAAPFAAPSQMAPASPAEQFHAALRLMEQNRAWASLAASAAPIGRAVPRAPGAPGAPPVGDQRTFQVLSNLSILQLTAVTATAQSVGTHVALYVDNNAPTNGLSMADYDKMRSDFDTLLYEADTAAFGRESDIDGNGLVIVLMTNVVNKLVTAQQCVSTGYVGGFFLGADIDPRFAGQGFNNGEIFYTMVADPTPTLPSCAHSIAQVQRVIPTTLIHEFQHMISYNQHVLVRGAPGGEVQWLNEGLSHYAEELGGRAVLAGTLGVDTVRYCNYVRGDLANLALYWADPGSYALLDTAGVGGLEARGAAWLFVRYLVDQFAADTSVAAADALTQQIDETNLTGAQNVTTVTGQPFAKTLKRWALAHWVNDLPGFTASPTMKYKHWKFRTDYPVLSAKCTIAPNPPPFTASFPLLAVASAGPSINLKGTIWAGSGAAYLRVLQGPSAPGFSLLFSDSSGVQLNSVVVPRLNVIRIR